MHITKHVRLAAAMITAAFAIGACSSGATPAPAAPTTAPSSAASGGASGGASGAAVTTVSIIDNGFQPADITVKVGTAVTWTNTGQRTHTVTFDGGPDSGNLAAGATFPNAFATAGTFKYHCAIHSSMQGTVTVTQ